MTADHELPVSQLQIDEIEELLLELGANMSDDELRDTAHFIKQVGSVEAAIAALEEVEGRAA